MSTPSSHVAIIGAGTTSLVGELIAAGYERITTLDLSATALERLRASLGGAGDHIAFVVSNACVDGAVSDVDVWHDRATFHFLVDDDSCANYAIAAAHAVRSGGHLVMSQFAPEGPAQCSGLPVRRHDERSLLAVFGEHFELLESAVEVHVTPWGVEQPFVTTLLRRR